MKKISSFTLTIFVALLFSNCSSTIPFTFKKPQKSLTKQESDSIKMIIPSHKGGIRYGSYGIFDYKASRGHVEISPSTKAITSEKVHVLDLDRDNKFDTVICNDYGTYRFGTFLSKKLDLIQNTMDSDNTSKYIELANSILKKIAHEDKIQKIKSENAVKSKLVSKNSLKIIESKEKTTVRKYPRNYFMYKE